MRRQRIQHGFRCPIIGGQQSDDLQALARQRSTLSGNSETAGRCGPQFRNRQSSSRLDRAVAALGSQEKGASLEQDLAEFDDLFYQQSRIWQETETIYCRTAARSIETDFGVCRQARGIDAGPGYRFFAESARGANLSLCNAQVGCLPEIY